ncbi:MAG: carboxymuconolactone decarboxylase family protein [Myxococcota bacterium]
MSDEARRERGKQRMEQIAKVPAFDPPDAFTAMTVDHVFGELWDRPGLSDRDRRLLSIAILAARGMEAEARVHVGGALQSSDLTTAEVMEVILHVAHYAGWPHAAMLYRTFRERCGELGLEVPGPEEES